MTKSPIKTKASVLEYKSKIAEIEYKFGQKYLIISNNNADVKMQIPLLENKPPSNGLFLGEKLIRENLDIQNALELGAGKYAPASFCLLLYNQKLKIDAIEIQQNDLKILKSLILLNNLSDRFNVRQGNLFNGMTEEKYDLIFSNMSQLPRPPRERNSAHDHGGPDGWRYLTKIIHNASKYLNQDKYLALMVFDFLGIDKRNNVNIPSLRERLEQNNFSIIRMNSYNRLMRQGGQTYKSFQYIIDLYPEALFHDAENRVVNPSERLHGEGPIYIRFHYVLSRLNSK